MQAGVEVGKRFGRWARLAWAALAGLTVVLFGACRLGNRRASPAANSPSSLDPPLVCCRVFEGSYSWFSELSALICPGIPGWRSKQRYFVGRGYPPDP